MEIMIKELDDKSILQAIAIWNSVVEDGQAFPQTELLDKDAGMDFFRKQSFTAVAYDRETEEVVGMYILHPNNVGRCGHICNASYAVKKEARGQHIGEELVKHCIRKARELDFKICRINSK